MEALARAIGSPIVLELPSDDEARSLLQRVGVPQDVLDEVLLARPTQGSPVWEQVGDRARELTVGDAPVIWPPPEQDATPEERWADLWALLAAVPYVVDLNRSRGVPDPITWATLEDVGVNLNRFRAEHGRAGFDGSFWLSQHVRGSIYRLGRLSFNLWRVTFDPPDGAGFDTGDGCLGVHVPAIGPLTPDACTRAFAEARPFFRRHLGHDFHIATCGSWLLDDQLREYLPATSNIVQFQDRFQLVDTATSSDDAAVLRFVFGRSNIDLRTVNVRSTLEKAVVEHLSAGGHFHSRTGWLSLRDPTDRQ